MGEFPLCDMIILWKGGRLWGEFLSRVMFPFPISPLFCQRHVYTYIRSYTHTSLSNNAGYENWQDQSPDMDLANYS